MLKSVNQLILGIRQKIKHTILMKKYNMIENRPELSDEEVQKGMDFNNVLSKANKLKFKFWKQVLLPTLAVTTITSLVYVFINYPGESPKSTSIKNTDTVNITSASIEAAETYSVFIGTIVTQKEMLTSKEELLQNGGLSIRGSNLQKKYQITGYTFTTLTPTGISQVNVIGGAYNPELKKLLQQLKSGQTVYFENIAGLDPNNKSITFSPISITIK